MGSLFGGSSGPSAADQRRVEKQEQAVKVQEANQAKELMARRRSGAAGVTSKTLFSQVLGTDDAIGKQTKLGG